MKLKRIALTLALTLTSGVGISSLSAQTVTVTFDGVSGFTNSYSEAGVTITGQNSLSILRLGDNRLALHRPLSLYKIDAGGQPFTVLSVQCIIGANRFTSPSGARIDCQTGVINFPASDWSNITSFTWSFGFFPGLGRPAIDNIVIQLGDNEAPEVACSVATDSLWSPNHKLNDVGLTYDVVDNVDPNPSVSVQVYSDEPQVGEGDGSTDSDATDDGEVLSLRSERSGNGDGRVYLIIVTATDESGNVGYDCCTVTVPKSKSKKHVAAVEAQALDARAECLITGEVPAGFHLILD